jgi:hypothetical protein
VRRIRLATFLDSPIGDLAEADVYELANILEERATVTARLAAIKLREELRIHEQLREAVLLTPSEAVVIRDVLDKNQRHEREALTRLREQLDRYLDSID